MKNYKLLFATLAFLSVLIMALSYLFSNRYYIQESTNNRTYTYIIDQWTGRTWYIHRTRKVEIFDESRRNNPSKPSTEIAIDEVKRSYTLSTGISQGNNDSYIRDHIQNLRGSVEVIGWKANKINDQTYLVWYEYLHNSNKRTIGLEYNSKSTTIRKVEGDPRLEFQYYEYLR